MTYDEVFYMRTYVNIPKELLEEAKLLSNSKTQTQTQAAIEGLISF